MPVYVPQRTTTIATGGQERIVRISGRYVPDYSASVETKAALAKAVGGRAAAWVPAPEGYYIPAFQGNPGVGTLTTKELLPTWGGGSVNGLTLSGYRIIASQMAITSNTTLSDCWIYGGSSNAGEYSAIFSVTNGARLTLTDCHIGNINGYTPDRGLTFAGGTVTAERCNFESGEDHSKIPSGSIFRMCHFLYNKYPPNENNPPPHGDCLQAEGGLSGSPSTTIEYCHFNGYTLASGIHGADFNNAPIIIKADLNNQVNPLIRNNYFTGGNYHLFLRNAGFTLTGTQVLNNIFSKVARYGVVSSDPGCIAVWSGNVDLDGNPV